MLKMSGTVDLAVGTWGTKAWLKDIGWAIELEWKPYMVDRDLGGFVTLYEGDVTFTTVSGAGHMVPADRPEAAY